MKRGPFAKVHLKALHDSLSMQQRKIETFCSPHPVEESDSCGFSILIWKQILATHCCCPSFRLHVWQLLCLLLCSERVNSVIYFFYTHGVVKELNNDILLCLEMLTDYLQIMLDHFCFHFTEGEMLIVKGEEPFLSLPTCGHWVGCTYHNECAALTILPSFVHRHHLCPCLLSL